MTENFYHIAHKLIAEHGAQASVFTRNKIERYTHSHDYNALKAWYEVEAALAEIESSKATQLHMETTV
jgi:hypothetical protein